MSSFSTLEASLRTLQAIAESYRGQMTPLVEQELLIILAKALAHKSHGAREAAFYLAVNYGLRSKFFYIPGNVKNL
jgi:hypothetical protein